MSTATIAATLQQAATDLLAIPTGSASAWPTAVNCLNGTVPSATSFTAWDCWNDAKVRHIRMQADVVPGGIAFIGTSITASWNVARVHPAGVNWGIGGDKLAGVLNRISSLTHLSNSGAVVLEMCVNDAGFTAFADIDAQLTKLYAWLTGPLVVLSMIPQGSGSLSIATMNAVNNAMAAKLSGRPNCALVDVTTPLQDSDGFMKMSLSIGDRMHPNAAGYAVLRPLIQTALVSVIF